MARLFRDVSGYWFVSFCFQNRRYKKSSGTKNKAEAKAQQGQIDHRLGLLRAGLLDVPPGKTVRQVIFEEEDAPAPTPVAVAPKRLDEFLEDYLRRYAPPAKGERTHKTEKLHVGHLLRFAERHGGKTQAVSGLTPRWFEEYKVQRAKKVRPVTVNKELTTFHFIMKSAVRDGLLAANPVDREAVPRFKADSYEGRFLSGEEIERTIASGDRDEKEVRRLRRFRYLAPDEIGRLLAIVRGTPLEEVVTLLAYTGARLGEALRLEWVDVDLEAGAINVRSWKGSRHFREVVRPVDIHPDLDPYLRALHERHPDNRWVLGGDGDKIPSRYTLAGQIERILKHTEFDGIRFHALRHSLASNMAAAEVDERVIDDILGHRTLEMRKRYRHLHPKNRRAAVAVLKYDTPGPTPVPRSGAEGAQPADNKVADKKAAGK